MIFWVYYIFGGEIFSHVSFERPFCFYTPLHILRAFPGLMIWHLGCSQTGLGLRTGKLDLEATLIYSTPGFLIRLINTAHLYTYLHYDIVETLRCSRSGTECRRTTSLAHASHFSPRHVYTLPPLSSEASKTNYQYIIACNWQCSYFPSPNPNQPLY